MLAKKMRLNVALICFFLLFLCISAGAVSLSSGKPDYEKGEQMVFSGELAPGQADVAIARLGSMVVFEEPVRAGEGGNFSFVYNSGFLDPSGTWSVSMRDANAGTEVELKSVPDSSVFVITFNSPIPGEYRLAEALPINLKIVYLGKGLDSAEVAAWGADGKKLLLERKAEGIYGIDYRVPFDAPVGDWIFTVAAMQEVNGKLLGGENSIHLAVAPAQVTIEVVEPIASSFEVEQPIPLVIRASYLDGTPLVSPTISATVNGKSIVFSQQPDGMFSAQYIPSEKESGELVFAVLAEDGAGNKGEETFTVVVGGWLSWFMKKNWPFFAIAFVAILAALIALKSRISRSLKAAGLAKERKAEMAKLKQVQHDYFEVQSIDRRSFEEKSAEIQGNIAKIDGKINAMEAKKKVIK